MNKSPQLKFDKIIKNLSRRKNVFGSLFYLSSGDNKIDYISAAGNFKNESQYYIASINKFFVSALILRLVTRNKLELNDYIHNYLDESVIKNLHIFNGDDYSRELKIIHLISLTSGLPCYLADEQPSGKKGMNDLEAGIDTPWPINNVINVVKKMSPHFPPGTKGKAKYGDTNHQILSLIIENILNKEINIVLEELFFELEMNDTFVCSELNQGGFTDLYYKSNKIQLPLFLNSTKNEIISTARDQMKFLKAFFEGYFYPKEKLPELQQWNRIFFPFHYGIGIQKFHIPKILSFFHAVPEMIGHCGSTGSVAFYIPERDLYVTGTVNQQANPSLAFQTIIKFVNKL